MCLVKEVNMGFEHLAQIRNRSCRSKREEERSWFSDLIGPNGMGKT
jgi:ABC-type branched-subunit amino acid transport system ATPase component